MMHHRLSRHQGHYAVNYNADRNGILILCNSATANAGQTGCGVINVQKSLQMTP
jgi:hypothetical protein